jgi:hypothetical protein
MSNNILKQLDAILAVTRIDHEIQEEDIDERGLLTKRTLKRDKEGNPISHKRSQNDVLLDYMRREDDTYYVTFTRLDKVGINPHSKYKTPNGIYCYPLRNAWEYYHENKVPNAEDHDNISLYDYDNVDDKLLRKKKINSMYKGQFITHLPFAIKQRNFNIFTCKFPNRILDVVSLTTSDCNNILKDLKSVVNNRLDYKRAINAAEIQRIYDSYTTEAGRQRPAHRIWYTIKGTAETISRKLSVYDNLEVKYEKGNGGKKRTEYRILAYQGHNIWTNLLRLMGYVGVLDKGIGLIHPSEPCQAVFFSKEYIDVKERFHNRIIRMHIKKVKDYENRNFLDKEIVEYPSDLKFYDAANFKFFDKCTFKNCLLTCTKIINSLIYKSNIEMSVVSGNCSIEGTFIQGI